MFHSAGNIRDEVLTSLRYTIAVGGNWILPSLRLRGQVAAGEDELHAGGRSGLDFYFDQDWLVQQLKEACPAMKVARSVYDIDGFALAKMPDVINPKDVYTLATGEPNGVDLPWPGESGSWKR